MNHWFSSSLKLLAAEGAKFWLPPKMPVARCNCTQRLASLAGCLHPRLHAVFKRASTCTGETSTSDEAPPPSEVVATRGNYKEALDQYLFEEQVKESMMKWPLNTTQQL